MALGENIMKQYENPKIVILYIENHDIISNLSVTDAIPDENYYPTWRK